MPLVHKPQPKTPAQSPKPKVASEPAAKPGRAGRDLTPAAATTLAPDRTRPGGEPSGPAHSPAEAKRSDDALLAQAVEICQAEGIRATDLVDQAVQTTLAMRLQMTMDRLAKLMSTLSNVLKKQEEAQSGIVDNMK